MLVGLEEALAALVQEINLVGVEFEGVGPVEEGLGVVAPPHARLPVGLELLPARAQVVNRHGLN